MKKKYELTDETIMVNGHILHRIKALKDFADVNEGDLGGFVESEDNLSQDGNCWIYDEAKVFENAKVFDDACVYERAKVFDDACVYERAKVYGDALVCHNAVVCGKTMVYGNAKVYDVAKVFGNAHVFGNAEVFGIVQVFGDAQVYDNAKLYGDAQIYGNAIVHGNTEISGNAKVQSLNDYMVFHNNWSSGRYFTWTKSNNMWRVGCFYGTGKQLIEKAYKDSEESGKKYETTVNYSKNINSI